MTPKAFNIILGTLVSFVIVLTVCILVFVIKDKSDSVLASNTIPTTRFMYNEITSDTNTSVSVTETSSQTTTEISNINFNLTGEVLTETVSQPYHTAAELPKLPTKVSQDIDLLPELEIKDMPNSTLINIEPVLQMPELPSGCEITALTTVLQHYNYNVTKNYMADNFLIKAEMGQSDFNNAFISNPRSKSSYGCYPPVIKYAANAYFLTQDSDLNAYNITGTDFDTILALVANGIPVIIWVSMDLIAFGAEYTVFSYNGNSVKWTPNEHVMVLTGYNKEAEAVYVCDPLKGKKTYNLPLFQQRYEQLDKKSVIIY